MSRQLISRSPDLAKLRERGYQIRIINNATLLVESVPYVTSEREVERGTIVCPLVLEGDRVGPPNDHQVFFAGKQPCRADGAPFDDLVNSKSSRPWGDGVTSNFSFSRKPKTRGYKDNYEKIALYVRMLVREARRIDEQATAKTHHVPPEENEEDVFVYADTASSRAGISGVTEKLEGLHIGIFGLGGTGSYILDLVSKTPVAEIHLFDDDVFRHHNAFRAPGAASLDAIKSGRTKVEYFKEEYSRMHKGIIAHPIKVSSESVASLPELDYAFVCIDDGGPKGPLADLLEGRGVVIIDVGMGVDLNETELGGNLRVTTSTPSKREHYRARVNFNPAKEDDAYSTNIQIADLNCLNAALAVGKWKRVCGFYRDSRNEHHSTYTIGGNMLDNQETVT